MGSVRVPSCRWCMFVSCVHPLAVHNAAFCMTCFIGRIECPHPVAVSAFMICRGVCACNEMLLMCVLYVSVGDQ